jgi:hypothetical protein
VKVPLVIDEYAADLVVHFAVPLGIGQATSTVSVGAQQLCQMNASSTTSESIQQHSGGIEIITQHQRFEICDGVDQNSRTSLIADASAVRLERQVRARRWRSPKGRYWTAQANRHTGGVRPEGRRGRSTAETQPRQPSP